MKNFIKKYWKYALIIVSIGVPCGLGSAYWIEYILPAFHYTTFAMFAASLPIILFTLIGVGCAISLIRNANKEEKKCRGQN